MLFVRLTEEFCVCSWLTIRSPRLSRDIIPSITVIRRGLAGGKGGDGGSEKR